MLTPRTDPLKQTRHVVPTQNIDNQLNMQIFRVLALYMRIKHLMAGILCKKTILIIDDDVRMLQALERVFTKEGASVTCFDMAVDAFKILAARPGKFDLLITDLRMPFVSGARTVSIVHNVLPELPIIVLTAFGDPDVKNECLRKGATAFLEKPVDASHLIEVVAKVLDAEKISENKDHTDSIEKHVE